MEVVVVGAAIVRDGRLFTARRTRPSPVAGSWELPGAEAADGGETTALDELFRVEFGIDLRCVDRILSDRLLMSWPTSTGGQGVLRVWRCQLPGQSTLDLDAGDPRPALTAYDDTRWVDLADLDAVSPWREADRITAAEIADTYWADEWWQYAD
jgi:8-oxo-dGTP diphosphatase